MELPELWAHQKEAIARAKEVTSLAILHEVGTGKTRTLIEILRYRYNTKKRIMRTLIIGPLIIAPQWKREFEKYSKVPQDKIAVLNKSGPSRLKLFTKTNIQHEGNFIAVTNYEALLNKDFYSALKEWAPEILIMDEAHRLKDHSSRRFKLLKPIADQACHKYPATGTPVLNSPLDLFAPYRLMDKNIFGDNFFAYRATYLYDKNSSMPKHVYFPNWVPRKDMIPVLNTILATTSVQARKEDCLSLPPMVRVEIPVEMSPSQQKAYESMAETYIAQVQNKTIAANLAITQTLRLQTILAGFIGNPEPGFKPLIFKENPRLSTLVDLLKDLTQSGKVIVWSNFIATYEMIRDALEKVHISSVFLTGQQSAKEKEDNVKEFTLGPIQVAICNPGAVGLGINLVESKYSVYYTRSYSLEHDLQSEARNYRGGSERHDKVTRYDLVCPDTLDEVVLKCLRDKGDLAESLMNWANLR